MEVLRVKMLHEHLGVDLQPLQKAAQRCESSAQCALRNVFLRFQRRATRWIWCRLDSPSNVSRLTVAASIGCHPESSASSCRTASTLPFRQLPTEEKQKIPNVWEQNERERGRNCKMLRQAKSKQACEVRRTDGFTTDEWCESSKTAEVVAW